MRKGAFALVVVVGALLARVSSAAAEDAEATARKHVGVGFKIGNGMGFVGGDLIISPIDHLTLDLQASIDFLLDHYDLVSGKSPYTFHYFYWYGHYYATQALYVIGGKAWAWYYPRMRDELVRGQLPSGAWPCTAGPGQAYSTAVGASPYPVAVRPPLTPVLR